MNKDFAKGMIVSLALKALPVRKKSPIAYLYNGVRLPELPYDKYPYTLIFQRPTDGKIVAWQLADPPQIVDGKCVCDATSYIYGQYRADTDDWSDGQYYENKVPGLASADWLIWTNYDIMDGTTVYMEASAPIPIYNEPVNYLYNGVKLPKLPETEHLYKFIVYRTSSGGRATAYATDAVDFGYNDSGNWSITATTIGQWRNGDESWTDTDGQSSPSTSLITWAEFDVLNAEGSVLLEASEPVPIYE